MGHGYECDCEILARKVELPEGSYGKPYFTYTQCSLVGAPINIPDGAYEVLFDGLQLGLSLQERFWSSPGDAHRIEGNDLPFFEKIH